jgi:hypothetical protein
MTVQPAPAKKGRSGDFDIAQYMSDAHRFSAQERLNYDESEYHIPLRTDIDPTIYEMFRSSLHETTSTRPHFREQSDTEKRMSAVGHLRLVKALVNHPQLLQIAAMLETREPDAVGGRPRKYPDWVIFIFACSISLHGSASRTAIEFRDGWWDLIRGWAMDAGLPNAGALPQEAPTRSHYRYFAERRLSVAVLHRLQEALMYDGISTGRQIGVAVPTGHPDFTHPHRPNVLGQDGKVMTSPVKPRIGLPVDKTTGEILPYRFDPAACLHAEGGEDGMAHGSKFSFLTSRSAQANERICFYVHHLSPGRGYPGESAVAVDLFRLIHKVAAMSSPYGERDSGIHAGVNDAAMRHAHIDAIQSATGFPMLTPTVKPSAKQASIKFGKKKYKATRLDPVPCPSGGPAHVLWAGGGGFFAETLAVDGTSEFVRLARTSQRQRSAAKWIMTAKMTIPCPHGDHQHSERITSRNDDEDRNLKRGEFIRWHDQEGDEYRRVYPMRADTESFNNQVEDVFYRDRIRAFGARKQLLLMLGYGFLSNVRAYEVHRTNPARLDRAA